MRGIKPGLAGLAVRGHCGFIPASYIWSEALVAPKFARYDAPFAAPDVGVRQGGQDMCKKIFTIRKGT
jgi:hypothetical protein